MRNNSYRISRRQAKQVRKTAKKATTAQDKAYETAMLLKEFSRGCCE